MLYVGSNALPSAYHPTVPQSCGPARGWTGGTAALPLPPLSRGRTLPVPPAPAGGVVDEAWYLFLLLSYIIGYTGI